MSSTANDMLCRFLPDYPQISDDDFYRSIVNKKEFWEKEEFPNFFQHQVNIARFMSQWTLYDSLLLFHEMGTGKSGVTVALTELCRKETNPLLKRIIYVSHNQPQIDNYKKEIEKFSPRLANQLLKGKEDKALRWNTILKNDGYEFYTMGVIDNQFSKRTDEWIRKNYEDSIFLIDEAHHLVKSKHEATSAYDQLTRIFQLIERKKVLVMTGTPITDKLDEIEPLLRLILPLSLKEELPPRDLFLKNFFEVDRTIETLTGDPLPVYRWKEGQREFFQHLLRGRISYIRRKTTEVPVNYMGNIYPPMQSLYLVVNPMKSIQNYVYRKFFETEASKVFAEEDDTKRSESSFYSKSRQASLFVFPEDGEEEEDEDANQIWNKQRNAASEFLVENRWTITPKYLKKLLGEDITYQTLSTIPRSNILEDLSQYSASYTKVIQEILENPTELAYIFCDLKEKSGVMVLQALLRSLFGFTIVRTAKDLKKTPDNRLIVLNDPFSDEKDFQDLIQYFNDPENKNGKWCQVIIGTEKTSEGISLKNVQQIHILTPSWNMGTMSQAMARSLRAGSHESGQRVRIFLHAAVPTEEEEETDTLELMVQLSLDFQRYFRSEIKERNLKLIERVFLESSWDCMMNMNINSKTGRYVDGSRECEYSICKYQCEGVSGEDPKGTDYSNWNQFYSSVSKEHLLTRIKSLFSQRSFYTKEQLFQDLRSVVDDTVLIHEVLLDVVQKPILLKDPKLFPAFLQYDRDSYFLIDNCYLPDPLGNYSRYYQQNPATEIAYPISSLLDGFYVKEFPRLFKELLDLVATNHNNAIQFFLSFPVDIQSLICETCVLAFLKHQEKIKKIDFISWFSTSKEFKEKDFISTPKTFEHYFVPEKSKIKRVLRRDNLERGWITVDLA